MEELTVRFQAALPTIQSAIKIGQDSARVQLDIGATDLAEVVKLAFYQGLILDITVTPTGEVNEND